MTSDQYPPLPGPLNPAYPIYYDLGIFYVQDVFTLQVSKFIYDFLPFNTPQIFWGCFNLKYTVHNYNTSSNSNVGLIVNNYFEVVVEVSET